MIKTGEKILHWLVLLFTGIALIGVNVQQLYCVHSDQMQWEVRLLPADGACPCEQGCCCCPTDKSCHDPARHDFYKVTDSSKIEQGIQITLNPLYLPAMCFWVSEEVKENRQNYLVLRRQEIFSPFPGRELLCTFRC